MLGAPSGGRGRAWFVLLALSLVWDSAQAAASPKSKIPRMNEVQFIGTHNSYHLSTYPGVPQYQYDHKTYLHQLEVDGIYFIEVDVGLDTTRGKQDHYRYPVYHIQTIDERSTCPTVVECLRPVAKWVADHSNVDFPLLIHLDPKESFDVEELIDQLTVPGMFESRLISTPDQWVRNCFGRSANAPNGTKYTLADTIKECGFPTVHSLMGKVAFVSGGSTPPGPLDGKRYFRSNRGSVLGEDPWHIFGWWNWRDALAGDDRIKKEVLLGRSINRVVIDSDYPNDGKNYTDPLVLQKAYFDAIDFNRDGEIKESEIRRFFRHEVSDQQMAGLVALFGTCSQTEVGTSLIGCLSNLIEKTTGESPFPRIQTEAEVREVLRQARDVQGAHILATNYEEPKSVEFPWSVHLPSTDWVVKSLQVRYNPVVGGHFEHTSSVKDRHPTIDSSPHPARIAVLVAFLVMITLVVGGLVFMAFRKVKFRRQYQHSGDTVPQEAASPTAFSNGDL